PFSLTPSGARSRTLRFRGARRLAERTDLREIGRGGREAEGAGLLNQYTAQSCIEGSNPSLSATVDEGPLAQLDRASDYESEGRRFESCRARHPMEDARRAGGFAPACDQPEPSLPSLACFAPAPRPSRRPPRSRRSSRAARRRR